MTLWVIEPRDPLIFGDGKPFSAIPGARAKSLPFPLPPTMAGSMRTHAGPGSNGQFDEPRVNDLRAIQVRGPLLAEMDENEHISSWLLPAPADVLLLKTPDKDSAQRLWLRPITLPVGIVTDLKELALIGPGKVVREKPFSRPPAYWWWPAYARWLEKPEDDPNPVAVDALGHSGPQRESRVHVSIKPDSQTALEGALFQTSGMEFVRASQKDDEDGLGDVRPLGLVIETDANLQGGLDFLGGERRIVHWQKADGSLPGCPQKVRDAIMRDRACRLILVTPAHFTQGFLPAWLRSCASGVEATIIAAAVQRYQTASGWDYEKRRPKPTRRLAPAGSVYFIKLTGDDDKAISRFVDTVWMQSVSDETQARLDGFGLAVLGTWDGALQTMEVIS
jgi:CRISPR-associated protein Cmr3